MPIDTARDISFIMLADVLYAEITDVIAGLDYAYPDAVKLGGLCAAASGQAPRTLIWWSAHPDAQNFEDGLVQVCAAFHG